ncbi:Peptidase-C25 domain-containing protein [Sulfidibacter corallicola]|uniref:Gingipain domain-containing protein n=1 Tax=Sulfidibacter corallicola TaxID=2818388 RepID=A0A8A4TS07_SULCO|nr:C25 family cysteine peptidase [Sulfidibacter corallicola]QTD51801.1 hypothetical protein J3U87_04965 [Sulfidibacter corallicola]
MEQDELWQFGGIDGVKGGYAFPPVAPAALADVALRKPEPTWVRGLIRLWRWWKQRDFLGPIAGVDPKRLDQAGWGVIFASDADPALREALSPLLAHRKAQAGERYREFHGEDGVLPGETKREFLARHGVGPGPADPKLMPYYLLIVADVTRISLSFQYQLDVSYGVGRVHFSTLNDYEAYANSVVAAETAESASAHPRSRCHFFGVHHQQDKPTIRAQKEMTGPLYDWLSRANDLDCHVTQASGRQASRRTLLELFRKPGGRPDLLFSVSHGLVFASGHENQAAMQGGLVCGDYRHVADPLSREHLFLAEDLDRTCHPNGMMWFLFNCYGLGTPRENDYDLNSPPLAPRPFISALPQRLLSHPNGGALAVVGHVERAKVASFSWPDAPAQIATFRSTFQHLLEGYPVGYAMECFDRRFAELTTELQAEIDAVERGRPPKSASLAFLWAARIDARNYLVFGDPAVRLRPF